MLKAETTIIITKNGKEIHRQKGHTFSKWFNRFLMNFLTGTGVACGVFPLTWTNYTIQDINNATKTMLWSAEIRKAFGVNKIEIGESDETWDYEQFSLVCSKMANTSNSKKSETEYGNYILIQYQGIFDITETFTIKETGLFGSFQGTVDVVNFLASRDVLETPIDVAENDTISVVYQIKIGV